MMFHSLDDHDVAKPLTHYAEWDAAWTYCGKHVKTHDWNAGLMLAKPGERPTCEQCAQQLQLDDEQFADMVSHDAFCQSCGFDMLSCICSDRGRNV